MSQHHDHQGDNTDPDCNTDGPDQSRSHYFDCEENPAADDLLGLLVKVRDLTGTAATLNTEHSSDDDLLDTAVELERTRSLIDATAAHVMIALDDRNCTARHGMTVEAFLSQTPKQSKPVCRKRLRTAKALNRHFNAFDEAISTGRLSWSHGEAIQQCSNRRIVDQLIELQPELIDLAAVTNFEHWRRQLLRLCRLLDQDGGFDPADDPEAARLKLTQDSLGVTITGNLTGESAIIAAETIDKVADELFTKYSNDQTHDPLLAIPDRAALRAQAFIEICRRSQGVDINSSKPPVTQTTLVIHNHDPRSAYTADGHQHVTDSISALCCDQRLQTLTIGKDGVPLFLGRSRRLATAAQRQAITVRDGGCVFPGCDAPAAWCVIHHVTPWHLGGNTDVSNMAMLCHHHHGVTHSNRWTMTAHPDQTFTWTTPTGHNIASQRHGVPTRHPEASSWPPERPDNPSHHHDHQHAGENPPGNTPPGDTPPGRTQDDDPPQQPSRHNTA